MIFSINCFPNFFYAVCFLFKRVRIFPSQTLCVNAAEMTLKRAREEEHLFFSFLGIISVPIRVRNSQKLISATSTNIN